MKSVNFLQTTWSIFSWSRGHLWCSWISRRTSLAWWRLAWRCSNSSRFNSIKNSSSISTICKVLMIRIVNLTLSLSSDVFMIQSEICLREGDLTQTDLFHYLQSVRQKLGQPFSVPFCHIKPSNLTIFTFCNRLWCLI